MSKIATQVPYEGCPSEVCHLMRPVRGGIEIFAGFDQIKGLDSKQLQVFKVTKQLIDKEYGVL